MKNGSFVSTAFEVVLNIMIIRISSLVILRPKTWQNLRLVSLSILVPLVDKHSGI